MFGLTEPSILKKLTRKAKEHLVPCHIHYDPTASPRLYNPAKNFHAYPVLTNGLMHQKILVIDEKMVFLGSANMTKSSLQMHDNLVIGLFSPKIASFLRKKTPRKSGYIKTMVGAQEVELYLLPDPRGGAIQAIKNQIQRADISLKISMFTFTHPALLQAIIDAKKRGVDVKVSIDRNARFGASSKAIEQLVKANIQVFVNRGSALMHHKFLVVDDRNLILGSANWTKAAFYKNHDSFVILHQLTEEQKPVIQAVWSSLEKGERLY